MAGKVYPADSAMRRPRQIPQRNLTRDNLAVLAKGATYVGSCEHKVQRWWGGLPKARQLPGGDVGRPGKQQTTICHLTSRQDQVRATGWLREAIRQRNFSFVETDQKYPKRVWVKAAGRFWCGFCINTAAGEYKGWPCNDRSDYVDYQR